LKQALSPNFFLYTVPMFLHLHNHQKVLLWLIAYQKEPTWRRRERNCWH